MFSHNSNLEEQFAKSRSLSDTLEKESDRISKIQLQNTKYLRGLNPPSYEWFALGSIKKSFFSPRRAYYFMIDTRGCAQYKVYVGWWECPTDMNNKDFENIAEIIAKKKAEKALSPVISKAR